MATASKHGLNSEEVFWLVGRIAPGLKAREAGFLGHVHPWQPSTCPLGSWYW